VSATKEVKALVRHLRRQGFTVSLTKRSGHYKVRHPESPGMVILPSTPSDARSLRNAVAQLRRIGFVPGVRRQAGKTEREAS
jgi:predicted RNA binding protein YcfA (HicA-like mRNA interferase family)